MSMPLSGAGVQPARVVRHNRRDRIVFIPTVYMGSARMASEMGVKFLGY